MDIAEKNTDGGKGKKGQPAKMNLRVDFTPMVDMNMLLITFFMFCTTLATPQIMDIVMPAKNTDVENPTQAPESRTVTLLLGENGKIFYYWGQLNYEDKDALKEVNSIEDLRNMLMDRNQTIVAQVNELKSLKRSKEITDDQFKQQMAEVKKSKEGLVVLIKPTKDCVYSSLIKTLDEMAICNVSQYAIVDIAPGDSYLIDTFGKHLVAEAR